MKRDTIAVANLEEDLETFEHCWKLSPGCRDSQSLKDLKTALLAIRKRRIVAPMHVLCAYVTAFVAECVKKEAFDVAAESLLPWGEDLLWGFGYSNLCIDSSGTVLQLSARFTPTSLHPRVVSVLDLEKATSRCSSQQVFSCFDLLRLNIPKL